MTEREKKNNDKLTESTLTVEPISKPKQIKNHLIVNIQFDLIGKLAFRESQLSNIFILFVGE